MKETDIKDLIELFESADETMVAELDRRIAQHQAAIDSLNRLRKVVCPPQKKTTHGRSASAVADDARPSARLQRLLLERGTAISIEDAMDALGLSKLSISMAVTRSADFVRKGDGISLASWK